MLDTLRYSKRLQSAGVSQAQADAQAEALRDEIVESVATKAQIDGAEQRLGTETKLLRSDLSAVEQRLDTKIDAVAASLSSDIKHVEQRLDTKADAVEQRLSAEIKSLRWAIGLLAGLITASLILNATVLLRLLP